MNDIEKDAWEIGKIENEIALDLLIYDLQDPATHILP